MMNKILNSNKTELERYFEIQNFYDEKYGRNAVVFWETNGSENYVVNENSSNEPIDTDLSGTFSNILIGTFFEVYEVNNDEEQIGKAKEIAELLNIQLTKKNKNIVEQNYYM